VAILTLLLLRVRALFSVDVLFESLNRLWSWIHGQDGLLTQRWTSFFFFLFWNRKFRGMSRCPWKKFRLL
jgi:hypothetical protein